MLTGTDIFTNVRALLPAIATRADEIASLRRLPAGLVDDLRAAGAFRIAVPTALGGPEMSPREQTELIEELAYVEPSVAWCVMIGSDAPYYGAFMDPAGAAEVWPDIDMVTAGLVQPAGQARPVEGGYLVTGRWAFGSGCTHADVIVGGCLVMDGDAPSLTADGAPRWLDVAAPAAEWEILDTWHTHGLAGSGSNDYAATDLFVPETHTFDVTRPPTRPEPLFRFPGMFFTNMSGVALGIGARAIDLLRETAPSKLVMPDFVMMKDLPRVRSAVAHADALLGSARAYVYDVLDRLWAAVVDGDDPDVETRRHLVLSRAHSFRTARDVVTLIADAVGGSSIYASHPLDRLLRDAHTICQHVVAQQRMYEIVGGMAFGDPSPLPIV